MTKKECIQNLKNILVSDKKIIFLLGSGCSVAAGVPGTKELLEKVEEECDSKILSIKEELGEKYDIESLISKLQSKKDVLNGSKEHLNKLSHEDFRDLIKAVERVIFTTIKDGSEKVVTNHHKDLVRWISGFSRRNSIEIFTTNYDCLIEQCFEELSVPFFDGFSGSLTPFFCVETVEDLSFLRNWTKLWKLHGSLNWSFEDKHKTKVVKRRIDDQGEKGLLIYPSNLKYEESRKSPYIAFMERLRDLLTKSETVLFTCGYSWKDEHINEIIASSLNKNSRASVFGFLHEEAISESIRDLCSRNKNISIYGKEELMHNRELMARWESDFEFTKFEDFVGLLDGKDDKESEN